MSSKQCRTNHAVMTHIVSFFMLLLLFWALSLSPSLSLSLPPSLCVCVCVCVWLLLLLLLKVILKGLTLRKCKSDVCTWISVLRLRSDWFSCQVLTKHLSLWEKVFSLCFTHFFRLFLKIWIYTSFEHVHIFNNYCAPTKCITPWDNCNAWVA